MADYKEQGVYQEGNSLFDDIFAFGDLEVQNINVVGIITAATFSGVDATSLKDTGGTVKIQATTTGATHSGRAVFNEVELQGKVYDSDGDFGTSGQVLSSDGTDIEWVNAGSLSAGSAAQVTVANEASDTTCFPLFSTEATGNLQTKSNTNLTFNSSTGQLNSTKFVGDGSGLTGFTAAQIPTINQDTTGTATNATNFNVTANNSTNETVFPVFVDGATGNQGGETDTGFTYNPSTGNLTATKFTGDLTGDVTGNINGLLTGTLQTAAQTNITSVGILNGLTVDGNVLLDNTSRYLSLKGALLDKDGETGANGEVLVSTGSQVDWQNPNTLTASNSIKVTITENDNNNDFPITFSIAAGQSGGNTLHSDNQFTYNALSNVVTAGTFSGSGASLTSLNASNLTGTVADARLSNSSLFVTGMIMMYNGSSAPSGWAICNGSNGTPDLRDRFIVGTGSSYSLGNTGGANSVTLTLNQIPAHTHTYERTDVGIDVSDRPWPASNNDCDMTNQNTSSAGGGQSHENRPPYYALMFIMKL